jgi:hypothetical protein
MRGVRREIHPMTTAENPRRRKGEVFLTSQTTVHVGSKEQMRREENNDNAAAQTAQHNKGSREQPTHYNRRGGSMEGAHTGEDRPSLTPDTVVIEW